MTLTWRSLARWAAVIACFAAVAATATAQPVDSTVVRLPDIEIEAVRGATTSAAAPFAVSLLSRDGADIAIAPGLSLSSTLASLPGVRITDRGHYALGERVIVRGMGWRSAFGVRGVQVLLDGFPLTLPDGQAVLDVVDPAFIRRAEAIRGPSSTFWGNGSGGVLVLSTDAFRDSSFVRTRVMGASHGVRQLSAESTTRLGKLQVHGFASSVYSAGFRDHSSGGFLRGGLNARINVSPKALLRLSAAAAKQDVQSPGGLTREQYETRPQLADPRNVATNAGKESTQAQAGATLDVGTRIGTISLTAYSLKRSLDNPLSFTYIDLNRTAGGTRAQLQNRVGRTTFGIGIDAGVQIDDRRNLNNEAGKPGSNRSLDQQERVRNLSAFGHATLAFGGGLSLSGGVRGDFVRFVLDDKLLTDGDQAGSRTFSAASPSLGISYAWNAGSLSALLFANISTAFETPTTTELVNQPDGSAGLNAEVNAQQTRGFEVGARGVFFGRTSETGRGLQFDVAAFRLDVSDRLVSFQDESGRTFFRNGGGSVHSGVEASLSVPIAALDALGASDTAAPSYGTIQATYTASHFTLRESSLDGNRIPAIPVHHLFVNLTLRPAGFRVQASADIASPTFADNENLEQNGGYWAADILVGHPSLRVGNTRLQPFAGIRNLFDTRYSASLVVNAFGGRYYEPSPGRTFQLGVGVTL